MINFNSCSSINQNQFSPNTSTLEKQKEDDPVFGRISLIVPYRESELIFWKKLGFNEIKKSEKNPNLAETTLPKNWYFTPFSHNTVPNKKIIALYDHEHKRQLNLLYEIEEGRVVKAYSYFPSDREIAMTSIEEKKDPKQEMVDTVYAVGLKILREQNSIRSRL